MIEPSDERLPQVRGFWTWLFQRDADGDLGIENLFDRFNALGIALAFVLAIFAHKSSTVLAKEIALPGAAALVGISFAWAGRSANLLQDKDFSDFIIAKAPHPAGYIYSFQLALLVVSIFVIVCLSLISGGFDISTGDRNIDSILNRFLLFSIAFVAARECWGVVYFVNKMGIQFLEVRKIKLDREKVRNSKRRKFVVNTNASRNIRP